MRTNCLQAFHNFSCVKLSKLIGIIGRGFLIDLVQTQFDVYVQVILVRRGLGETFPALFTLIWFFSCVDPLMRNEVPGLSESFRTETTLKRLFTTVNSHVHLENKNIHNTSLQFVRRSLRVRNSDLKTKKTVTCIKSAISP